METEKIIETIKNELSKQNITQIELAKIANIPLPTLKNFLTGKTKNPRIDTIQAIENALGIKKINHSDILEEVAFNDPYLIPLLGSVVAGVPIEAQEDLECYISCSFKPAEEYFALRVHGDSMKNAGIQDKSIIICHKQETAENGEIAAVLVNGNDVTLKQVKIEENGLWLIPFNSTYSPKFYTKKECAELPVRILGKMVELRAKF